jgi:pimeloyl-ACP methyl ester carboxylesterase
VTPYVDLDGVRSWYDERGAGNPLVLLHGGVIDSRLYEQNAAALADHFHAYSRTVGATGEHQTSKVR